MSPSDSQKSSYLDLVKARDNFPYDTDLDRLHKLYLPDDDRVHGYMLPEIVSKMPWTPEFTIAHRHPLRVQLHMHPVDLAPSNYSPACNNAFASVIDQAIERDIFSTLHAEHSEPYAIPGAKAPVQLERSKLSSMRRMKRRLSRLDLSAPRPTLPGY
ncbi:hypothetical protein DSL72_005832 [Monilinia vaccinii-corymbosi]|uniref:Uncharacterized protein n=1 Tax=Monilinia vaccinii-corymbosi TaxID=61207 RepID=A0A8A3PG60_9HELO|nr:hypothetical protein DSL72_005832 [Monilinia vaccinii-corymbosi]